MPLTIEVKGIKAYGKHGVYAEEKKEEQLFLIDVKAILRDTSRARDNIEEDLLEETINYETIVESVIELVKEESFNLIETLALKIVDVLRNPKLQEILVTVHKPNTILNQSTEDISVTASEKF
mgnify:FL=1|tara:strand:- start:2076 stop:2444 length:369 start_codon:yes stop_codon:yes gene_type:complete